MLNLIYINTLGKNSDDLFVYEFYFSEEPEMAWGIDWDIKPAVICNISTPQKMNYDVVKILKTNITLVTAQKNSCFSMQDCKDGIIPVAWEDIDGYDEYPENGRIVLPFGYDINDTQNILTLRGLSFYDENNNLEF